MKKAEEREESKGKELRTEVLAILKEVEANTKMNGAGASASSNVAIKFPALKRILKKAGSKP